MNNWVAGRRGRYYDEFRIVFRPGDAQVNELNREDRFCGRSILRASRLLVKSRPGFSLPRREVREENERQVRFGCRYVAPG